MKALNRDQFSGNATNSRVCQLPDELILKIFKFLTLVDIQLLKRCCRRLFFLCEEYADRTTPLAAAVFNRKTSGSPAEHWWEPLQNRHGLRDILIRDRTCRDCTELRADPIRFSAAMEELERRRWCSGCESAHPSFLFSHAERRKPALDRICIGLEGHVRLCQHEVITWLDILRLREETEKGAPLAKVGIECLDFSHLTNIPSLSRCMQNYFPKAQYHAKLRNTLMVSSKKALSAAGEDETSVAEGIVGLLDEAGRSGQVYTCPHGRGRKYRVSEPSPLADYASRGGYRSRARYRSRYFEQIWPCAERRCRQYLKLDAMTTDDEPCTEYLKDKSQKAAGAVKGGREVFLRSYNTISVETPVDPAWLVALEPESYLCPEDEQGKGIVWCEDEDCPTMFRSLARSKLFHWQSSDSKSLASYKPYSDLFKEIGSGM